MSKTTAAVKYIPSNHAIERAVLRFGVAANEAVSWFNDLMRKAKYVKTESNKLMYEANDGYIVVDGETHRIITIKPKVDVESLKEIFDREKRKARRILTKTTRTLEMEIAHLTIELGEQALNKARAKNPNTREIIQRKIDGLQTEIDACNLRIEKAKDEYSRFLRAIKIYE